MQRKDSTIWSCTAYITAKRVIHILLRNTFLPTSYDNATTFFPCGEPCVTPLSWGEPWLTTSPGEMLTCTLLPYLNDFLVIEAQALPSSVEETHLPAFGCCQCRHRDSKQDYSRETENDHVLGES